MDDARFEKLIQDTDNLKLICETLVTTRNRSKLIIILNNLLELSPQNTKINIVKNKHAVPAINQAIEICSCSSSHRIVARLRSAISILRSESQTIFDEMFNREPLLRMLDGTEDTTNYKMLSAFPMRVKYLPNVTFDVCNTNTDLYLHELRIWLARVSGNVVICSDGLIEPMQLLICENEPPLTPSERVAEGCVLEPRITIRDEMHAVFMKIAMKELGNFKERADFVHQIMGILKVNGDIEIIFDEESGLNNKNIVNLFNLRNPSVPYGIFADAKLFKPDKGFWFNPTRWNEGCTIAEELFFHRLYQYKFDYDTLAMNNLDARGMPRSLVCSASRDPVTGRLLKVKAIDAGLGMRMLELSLIDPIDAAEESAYIRLVCTP